MQVYREIAPIAGKTAVALGLFDGLHRGHLTVLQQAVGCGESMLPTVFTFVFDGEATKAEYGRVMTPSLKREKLREMGIAVMVEPVFSAIRSLSAEDFFHRILVEKLNAGAIFCGYDYRFGYGARGDIAMLQKLCEESGIRFAALPPVMEGGTPVSATRIRQHLRGGEIQQANQLLGYRYAIDYPVVHGRKLGRTLGFPTINQLYEAEDVLPKFGVYATVAELDGQLYRGVTNVGVKPTVGEGNLPAAETYLLDYTGDLYGRRVTLSFLQYLRGEQKFQNVTALKEQIAQDEARVREMAEI